MDEIGMAFLGGIVFGLLIALMPLFILWANGRVRFIHRTGDFEEVSNSAPYGKGICLGGFLNQKTKGELRRRRHET